ncbi:hypothetical protein BASA81_009133 [Batrachochytrium salamandrivorans]|nr:hypothetical protein BASA81_009133 [Batrachochytrium salamandrivorans]
MQLVRRSAFGAHRLSRRFSTTTTQQQELREKNKSMGIYMLSIAFATLGMAYSAIPMYKMFCQATGFGGTTITTTMEKANAMQPVVGAKKLTINFTGTTSSSLPWKFVPLQKEIKVVPGETALAFFSAENKTDKPVTGVATYNVTPSKAGAYFHKIQCFCFDEQRLRPGEQVDMPVFFFIDPDILEDASMNDVTHICLSYTFFKSRGSDENED